MCEGGHGGPGSEEESEAEETLVGGDGGGARLGREGGPVRETDVQKRSEGQWVSSVKETGGDVRVVVVDIRLPFRERGREEAEAASARAVRLAVAVSPHDALGGSDW